MKTKFKVVFILICLILTVPLYKLLSDYYYYNIAPPQPSWVFKFDETDLFANSSLSGINLLFKDRIIVADQQNLYAVEIDKGNLIWKYKYPQSYYPEFYNLSNRSGIVLFSEEINSVIVLDPSNGKEITTITYDPEKYNIQNPLDFEEFLKPYLLKETKVELEFSYKKPGEINIQTPKTNYEHHICRHFTCITNFDPFIVAKDSKTNRTKWKYDSTSEGLNANEMLLFMIKNDGVYAYRHI